MAEEPKQRKDTGHTATVKAWLGPLLRFSERYPLLAGTLTGVLLVLLVLGLGKLLAG